MEFVPHIIAKNIDRTSEGGELQDLLKQLQAISFHFSFFYCFDTGLLTKTAALQYV